MADEFEMVMNVNVNAGVRTHFVTGVLAGFSADLDDGHIPASRTTNCVL